MVLRIWGVWLRFAGFPQSDCNLLTLRSYISTLGLFTVWLRAVASSEHILTASAMPRRTGAFAAVRPQPCALVMVVVFRLPVTYCLLELGVFTTHRLRAGCRTGCSQSDSRAPGRA